MLSETSCLLLQLTFLSFLSVSEAQSYYVGLISQEVDIQRTVASDALLTLNHTGLLC